MFLAATTYLNPDEVMHASTGFQHSGLGMWKAAFQWHHPPLLVFLVGWMGNFSLAEWWLRLIPVLAGTFALLFAGLWAHRLTGDRRAQPGPSLRSTPRLLLGSLFRCPRPLGPGRLSQPWLANRRPIHHLSLLGPLE